MSEAVELSSPRRIAFPQREQIANAIEADMQVKDLVNVLPIEDPDFDFWRGNFNTLVPAYAAQIHILRAYAIQNGSVELLRKVDFLTQQIGGVIAIVQQTRGIVTATTGEADKAARHLRGVS